ncbi:MAG: TnpV protein [Eubacteriales bacterium]|nr:TnpV protein [Eubacteriales bacterium]
MKEITYTKQGDYLIPNLTLPKQPDLPLGRYAQMRRQFLQEHRKATYTTLLTSFQLTQHLYEIEQTALNQLNQIVTKLAATNNVTEQMKAENPIRWTQLMNSFRQQAEEEILNNLIYN